MSDFNDANDWAYQLVHGQHYEDRTMPCIRPPSLIFTKGNEQVVFTQTETDWRSVANRIQRLLLDGFVPVFPAA
jgi:hypothetical protein